ncbi:Uncharacterised protein [marine metagenome]
MYSLAFLSRAMLINAVELAITDSDISDTIIFAESMSRALPIRTSANIDLIALLDWL